MHISYGLFVQHFIPTLGNFTELKVGTSDEVFQEQDILWERGASTDADLTANLRDLLHVLFGHHLSIVFLHIQQYLR